MKILAIEASGPVAGCALMEDDILRAEYSIQDKMRHSRTLVPMMEEIRSRLELDLAEIDAVAVTKGPGSFTGLRIGAATAKGLGLALEKPLIPVPTVDCIAWNLYGTDSLVCPLMDARRQQVYTGIYECRESLRVLLPQRAAALTEILDRINALGRRVIFLGDGVPVNRKALDEETRVPYSFAPAHLSRQKPGTLADLAMRMYLEQGEACFVSADDFRPEYLRQSQAERERGDKRSYSLLVETDQKK